MSTAETVHAAPHTSGNVRCSSLRTGKRYAIVVERALQIRQPRWVERGAPVTSAKLGGSLQLVAEVRGRSRGARLTVEVFADGLAAPVATLQGAVRDGRLVVDWQHGERPDVPLHRYTFVVKAPGLEVRSPALQLTDDVWLELHDDEEQPRAGVGFLLIAPDGSEHGGRLDGRGRAFVPNIAAGACRVRFDEEAELVGSRAPQRAPALAA